ncbi:MmcQ/YjbR family DNA-binding protein [Pedobacter rhizosphaerae]|uniref:YjbR protein n=1 Tax=Pedobacter rhizosphaerae TaxID=390241 RepID=A0A1H9LZ80_9SPHI|nr:MmcQ/YjbR family DNA-binding protein [Pedobacter rhizosphaerae]SER16746.1 YjbR protein [Pedobacter rhizosphaerae]
MTASTFKNLALAFEEVTEQPHFEKTSFRVKKKIIATLDEKTLKASFKLTEIDQSVFCTFKPKQIYPATGAWGRQGWTIFELADLPTEIIQDALTLSYRNVAPKNLASKYEI